MRRDANEGQRNRSAVVLITDVSGCPDDVSLFETQGIRATILKLDLHPRPDAVINAVRRLELHGEAMLGIMVGVHFALAILRQNKVRVTRGATAQSTHQTAETQRSPQLHRVFYRSGVLITVSP